MTLLRDLPRRFDAVVVGARCAGAATAMLLARKGLDVLLVDRSRPGSDTLSTLALMRTGVQQLVRWGLAGELERLGAPAIHTTTFHYGDEALEIAIKPRDGVEALYAPRRTVLDAMLADAAARAGATVRHEVRLVELLQTQDRVHGVVLQAADGEKVAIRADRVIGADGRASTVARLAGASRYRVGRHAGGVIYGYFAGLPHEGYHWYYRDRVSAGVIPTNDDEALVFVSMAASRFRSEMASDLEGGLHRVLDTCDPELARSVQASERRGWLRGFPGVEGFFRGSWGPGWALVGDAGYYKDPITAHGISDALRDAELLAAALLEGGDSALAGYQQTRDELSLELFEATDAIAAYDWDLTAVQSHHLRASKAMNREAEAMLARDREPLRATA